ncbi:MAG: hypothetical protein ACYSUQ_08685 [Planctomycetota bacterium]|jgi:hypothetical protein
MPDLKRDPALAEVRTFGLVMLCGFAVIGLLLWWRGCAEATGWGWAGTGLQWAAVVLWTLGVLALIVTRVSAAAGRSIYVRWMAGASYLGMVMTFVLLSLLFVVLLPVFSLIRLKDPLRIGLARRNASYWEDHEHHESTLERTARPF